MGKQRPDSTDIKPEVVQGELAPTEEIQEQVKAVFEMYGYSAPLPPAEEMDKYEKTHPGAADRIIAMAEKEQQHRHKIQNTDIENQRIFIENQLKNDRSSSTKGFIIAVVGLVAAVVTALLGQPIVGGIIGTVDIVGLVSVFVIGKTSRNKENVTKDSDYDSD